MQDSVWVIEAKRRDLRGKGEWVPQQAVLDKREGQRLLKIYDDGRNPKHMHRLVQYARCEP